MQIDKQIKLLKTSCHDCKLVDPCKAQDELEITGGDDDVDNDVWIEA